MGIVYQFGSVLSSLISCVDLARIQEGNHIGLIDLFTIVVNERLVDIRIVSHLHKVRTISVLIVEATNDSCMDILLLLPNNTLPALLRNLKLAVEQEDIIKVKNNAVGLDILHRPTLLGEIPVDKDSHGDILPQISLLSRATGTFGYEFQILLRKPEGGLRLRVE